jgi:hypothetical protein
MRRLIFNPLLALVFFGLAALAQSAPQVAAPVAVIPFELVVNHLYVQASVNDSPPLSVLVDTGDSMTMIDSSRSIKLGLPMSVATPVSGFGNEGPSMGRTTMVGRITMSGVTLNNVTAISTPLDFFSELVGHDTDVVIGTDLFSKYVVEVDYRDHVLHFYDPATYVEPRDGCQCPLFLGVFPKIQAQLMDNDGREIAAMLVLDTGSNYSVVTKSFGDSHPSLSLDRKTIEAAPRRMLNGVTRFRVGRLRAISLGGCVVEKTIAAFSQDTLGVGSGDPEFSASVGMNVLQYFTTVFDYGRRVVTFMANERTPRHSEHDMTGIHLLAKGSSFHDITVDYVLSDSPAAQRDIKVGDKIDSANHRPASNLTVSDLDELFRRRGTLRLTLSRNGKRLKKKLKLKPLI